VDINITTKHRERPKFDSLKPGDVFMLPNGDTVYMVSNFRKAYNCPYHCINLRNGNVYDYFKGKPVIKLNASLSAWPERT